MAKRVKFTDTGRATLHGGYPIYDETFDGQPLGQTWQTWGPGVGRRRGSPSPDGWTATAAAVRADGLCAVGPNRGRAVAALLVKAYGLPWSVAFDAAGVR